MGKIRSSKKMIPQRNSSRIIGNKFDIQPRHREMWQIVIRGGEGRSKRFIKEDPKEGIFHQVR
jgi:hypothetical protein